MFIEDHFRERTMFDEDRWHCLVEAAAKIEWVPGACVEIGCHRCGVLAWLANHFPDRRVRGFDRFEEGLTEIRPEDCHPDTPVLQAGMMSSNYQDSLDYLTRTTRGNVNIVRGDVRTTLDQEQHYLIALAVIDLDLYDPTRYALAWTNEWLAPGGIILVDDVVYSGVRQALDECGHPWQRDGHFGVVRR